MKTELFIKQITNPANEILNPNFTEGMDDWSIIIGCADSVTDYGVLYLAGASNNVLQQDDVVNKIGKYKVSCTITVPRDGNIMTGSYGIYVSGIANYMTTPGYYEFYIDVVSIANPDIGITAPTSASYNLGGITNIKLEGMDHEYKQIDLADDIFIPITYNIADIADITKKNASFSKTISIPGTSNNNEVFEHIYNLTAVDTFELNSSVFCYILQDTQEIFNGTFELTKVLRKKGQVEYEGNVFSQLKSLYTNMGDKLLRGNALVADDLNFSEYNHIMNPTNINSSFSVTNGSGYVYVPINKDIRGGGTFANPEKWRCDAMSPSLFAKEILTKILAKAGFTYTSDFLDSAYFESLIYPFTDRWMRMADVDVAKSSARCSNGVPDQYTPNADASTLVYTGTTTKYLEDEMDGGAWVDTNNGEYVPWNSTTEVFEAKRAGYFNVDIKFGYDVYLVCDNWGTAPVTTWQLTTIDAEASSGKFVNSLYEVSTSLIHKRGAVETVIATNINSSATGFGLVNTWWMTYGKSDYPIIEDTFEWSGSLYCLEDDIVFLRRYAKIPTSPDAWDYNGGSPTGTWFWNKDVSPAAPAYDDIRDIRFLFETTGAADNYFKFAQDTKVTEDCVVDPTIILHDNVKQSDFVTSVTKMFNLYIEQISDNELRIEPRDEYYGSDVVDWTEKLDLSHSIEAVRASDGIDKVTNFKYSYDDSIKESHFKRINPVDLEYGEYYNIERNNIDDNDLNKIEIIFAPAPHQRVGPDSSIEVPVIYRKDDNGVLDQNATFKPRILFWNGLQNSYVTGDSFIIDGETSDITKTGQFPSASHFNDTYGTETEDLMFGTNYNLYYCYPYDNAEDASHWVTGSNLYNKFYHNMMYEYLDTNAKLVTMYLNLNETDIATFSFTKNIFIDGMYYRVNKIYDFVPGVITKVELLTITIQDFDYDTPVLPNFIEKDPIKEVGGSVDDDFEPASVFVETATEHVYVRSVPDQPSNIRMATYEELEDVEGGNYWEDDDATHIKPKDSMLIDEAHISGLATVATTNSYDDLDDKPAEFTTATAYLSAGGWSASGGYYVQTESVTGVTATNDIIVTAKSTRNDYNIFNLYQVIALSQAAGTITFQAATLPAYNLNTNIIIFS